MGAVPSLLPSSSYEEMCIDLAHRFRSQELVPFEERLSVRLVGLLFARPKTSFAATEIVPSLRYYHQRSGKNINFYCAGFALAWDLETVPDPDILTAYSDEDFDTFRRDIETRTKWRYSAGADLLLANARFDGLDAELDFSSMISANLVKMKADGAIDSVDAFFEQIFQYAETGRRGSNMGVQRCKRKTCRIISPQKRPNLVPTRKPTDRRQESISLRRIRLQPVSKTS